MAQAVQLMTFQLQDFQTEAGIQKLNLFILDLVNQIQAMQGTTGTIKPDADIDMSGKYRVINQKP